MNDTRFKQIAIFVLVTIIAIGLPASFAKYMKDDSFNLNVKVEVPFTFTADTVTGENVSGGKITIKKSGWYAIAVKGGDGGTATVINSGSAMSGKDVPGGPGGLISIKVYLNKDDVLVPFVGTAGGNASKGTAGSAGTVSTVLGAGGKGCASCDTSGATGKITKWIGSIFSNAVASGGGGAATSLFVGSPDSTYSNLLCVAGGGGGAAGWSYNYSYPDGSAETLWLVKTVPSGFGGAGGSNVLGNADTSPINDSTIFAGADGKFGSVMPGGTDSGSFVMRSKSGKISYGGGATNVGGAGSSSTNSWNINGTGQVGANYAANANGGKGANSSSYGGAGGGGYCGGGAGAGCSIEYSAGGGGGGSSYYKSSVNGKDVVNYVATNELSSLGLAVASKTYAPYELDSLYQHLVYTSWSTTYNNYSNNPESDKFAVYNVTKDGSNVSGGFVIVKYLGQS